MGLDALEYTNHASHVEKRLKMMTTDERGLFRKLLDGTVTIGLETLDFGARGLIHGTGRAARLVFDSAGLLIRGVTKQPFTSH